MNYNIVGNCPKCGAPIYSNGIWEDTLPPKNIHTCSCKDKVEYLPFVAGDYILDDRMNVQVPFKFSPGPTCNIDDAAPIFDPSVVTLC